jgi:hypothetical protein
LLEHVGEVLVPPAVDRELARHVQDWTSRRPGWLLVEAPTHPVADLEQWAAQIDLGAGEMEAHGSLGVVLWAAGQAHISRDEAAAILDRLAVSSLWISPTILAEARRALNALS